MGTPGWLSGLSIPLSVSAEVIISWFMGSIPASGSMLIAWKLLGILSFPLCLPLPQLRVRSLSLSLSKHINKLKKKTLMNIKHLIKVSYSQ